MVHGNFVSALAQRLPRNRLQLRTTVGGKHESAGFYHGGRIDRNLIRRDAQARRLEDARAAPARRLSPERSAAALIVQSRGSASIGGFFFPGYLESAGRRSIIKK